MPKFVFAVQGVYQQVSEDGKVLLEVSRFGFYNMETHQFHEIQAGTPTEIHSTKYITDYLSNPEIRQAYDTKENLSDFYLPTINEFNALFMNGHSRLHLTRQIVSKAINQVNRITEQEQSENESIRLAQSIKLSVQHVIITAAFAMPIDVVNQSQQGKSLLFFPPSHSGALKDGAKRASPTFPQVKTLFPQPTNKDSRSQPLKLPNDAPSTASNGRRVTATLRKRRPDAVDTTTLKKALSTKPSKPKIS